MVFRFDHRLFQRGHTWRECRESWQGDRERFLSETIEAKILDQTASILAGMDSVVRIAVYFDPDSIDSSMLLPFIGGTFAGLDRIESRYFDRNFFFPVFYPAHGRGAPRIFFIGQSGDPLYVWGPRPEQITREMEEGAGGKSDQWLLAYDAPRYGQILDQSLAGCPWDALRGK